MHVHLKSPNVSLFWQNSSIEKVKCYLKLKLNCNNEFRIYTFKKMKLYHSKFLLIFPWIVIKDQALWPQFSILRQTVPGLKPIHLSFLEVWSSNEYKCYQPVNNEKIIDYLFYTPQSKIQDFNKLRVAGNKSLKIGLAFSDESCKEYIK